MSSLVTSLMIGFAQLLLAGSELNLSRVEAAQLQAQSCLNDRAKRWSTLPDDASDIADASLYACSDLIEAIWPEMRAAMLADVMKSGQSPQNINPAVSQFKNETLEHYRQGVIAVVIQERYIRSGVSSK